jgi:hypothetical protein
MHVGRVMARTSYPKSPRVIGMDISSDVIAHATRKMVVALRSDRDPSPRRHLHNAIFSFETLEHIAQHELMLQEVK